MKWDTVCRPTDDPFWTFSSPSAQEPLHPQTIFVYFRQLKKIYILGIHPQKIIIPASFHSKAFVLLSNFETSWALLGRLSRRFFPISGASRSNFKHFKQLFITLSGLGYLTMWELPRWVSYFVSSLLKNYFTCFLQDFWSSHSFFAFKTFITPWSFYHPTFGFFQFFSSFYNR